MLKSKVFWIAAIIFAFIIFIVSLNTGRAYRGETDILFVPKSEKAVENIDQILANAERLPKSLSFYDKLLELNPDIEDPASGQTDENRKKAWDAEISSKRLGISGIVRVSAFSGDQSQAEVVSQKTATDITAVMSRYYDTKNDLDMRVIDGPIVYASNQNKISTWIMLSLLLGIAAGMIVYLFSTLAETAAPKAILAKPAIFGQEMFSVKKENLFEKSLKNIPIPTEEAPYFPINKKSDAPENLPIGENFGFNVAEKKSEPEIIEEETMKVHEATAEEVRARLNKLLGGGM
ncbi:MAG: hypothetical protein WC608_01135 [Parcubacteria group bacterium]